MKPQELTGPMQILLGKFIVGVLDSPRRKPHMSDELLYLMCLDSFGEFLGIDLECPHRFNLLDGKAYNECEICKAIVVYVGVAKHPDTAKDKEE
jgi:hypothetical protein